MSEPMFRCVIDESAGQLELAVEPRCDYCGPLGWTEPRYGRTTHKCGCPHRTDTFCQAHPAMCDVFTDVRHSKKHSYQKNELPGTSWEDIFE